MTSDLDFRKIAIEYDLGSIIGELKPVKGGLLHQVWFMKTTKGKYAVKQLNLSYETRNPNLLNQLQAQEVAAKMLAHGIPTVSALQPINQNFLVLPWIEGNTLSATQISPDMAYKIGEILANIHAVNLQQVATTAISWEGFSKEQWRLKLQKLDHLAKLIKWSEQAKTANAQLNQKLIFSHRDLDDKNVLWQNDTPTILDWEYSGLIDATLDLLIVALNFSGVQYGIFHLENLKTVFNAYCEVTKAAVEITPEHIYLYFGYCLDWIINAPEQHSQEEMLKTINAIELVELNLQAICSGLN
jgi:thiamine kinase-like enzyme